MPHPATAAPARAMPGAERVPASCGASDALPRASPARPLAPWRPRKHPSSNCGPTLGPRAAALRGALGARGAAGSGSKTTWERRSTCGAPLARGAPPVRWECFKDSLGGARARGRANPLPSTGMMPRSGQAGQMGACLLPASFPPPSREKAPKGRSRASSQGALWRRRGAGIGAAEEACGGKSIPPDPSVGLPAGKAGRR